MIRFKYIYISMVSHIIGYHAIYLKDIRHIFTGIISNIIGYYAISPIDNILVSNGFCIFNYRTLIIFTYL